MSYPILFILLCVSEDSGVPRLFERYDLHFLRSHPNGITDRGSGFSAQNAVRFVHEYLSEITVNAAEEHEPLEAVRRE